MSNTGGKWHVEQLPGEKGKKPGLLSKAKLERGQLRPDHKIPQMFTGEI